MNTFNKSNKFYYKVDYLALFDFVVEFALTITNKNLYRIYNNEKSKNYKLNFNKLIEFRIYIYKSQLIKQKKSKIFIIFYI